MVNDTLAAALEHEHREIDEGIEAFTSGQADAETQTAPLTRAMDALRRHIYLEEEFLFPPLRSAGLMAPVFVMLREHGEMWKTLDLLERGDRQGRCPDCSAGPLRRTRPPARRAQRERGADPLHAGRHGLRGLRRHRVADVPGLGADARGMGLPTGRVLTAAAPPRSLR